MKCTFCEKPATPFTTKSRWPACKLHSKLGYKYCVSTPNGPKLSPGGVKLARKTGVDEAIIMLYSMQSSTKSNEKSPRGRIGGTTKSESRHLTGDSRDFPTGNSNWVQNVGSNFKKVQQRSRKKVITPMGSAGIREREDDPY